MADETSMDAHLNRLRAWRTPRDRASDLSFIRQQFKRDHERAYKQVQSLVELWEAMVPDDLRMRTRLDGFSRGVLRVTVDSSTTLYEIDRLLRGGVQQQMIRSHKPGTLRRVQLRVGPMDTPKT